MTANLGTATDKWLNRIEEIKQHFITSMDDDFNTANAVTDLFDLSKEANLYLGEDQVATEVLERFLAVFDELSTVLGVTLTIEKGLLDEEVEQLIRDRDTARKERDFARADAIRDQLRDQGILLEDTAQGMRWKRG